MLKYKNSSGNDHRLTIIDRACHKWREIAALISSNPNKAACLEMQYGNEPSCCLRQLFIECFITNKPAGNYSQDWKGIIELLNDVKEEELAKEIEKTVVTCQK